MDISIFSKRLTQARQKKKLNFKELAELSGVTATAISYYEKGTKTPQLDNAVKIATALGVSLDWLCGVENKNNSNHDEKETILRELIDIMDKFDIDTLFEAPSYNNDGGIYLRIEITSLMKSFIGEYQSIQQMEKMTNLMTPEMKNDLINGLIKKYKNKNLLSDEVSTKDFLDMPDDEDLPF